MIKSLFELSAEFVGEHGSLYPDTAFACQPRPVLEKILTKLSAADLYRLDDILVRHGFDVDSVWRSHCQTLHLLRRPVRDEFGETGRADNFKTIYHHKQFHSLITVLSLGHFAALCDSPTPTDLYTVPLHQLKHFQKTRRLGERNEMTNSKFLMKSAKYCKKLVLNGRHVHFITSKDYLMCELVKYVESIVISPLTRFCYYNLKSFLTQLLGAGHLKHITLRGSSLYDEDLIKLMSICSGCSCFTGDNIVISGGVDVDREVSRTGIMSTYPENPSDTPSSSVSSNKHLISALSSPNCSAAENDNFKQFCEFYLQDEEMDWTLGEGTSNGATGGETNPQEEALCDTSSSDCDTCFLPSPNSSNLQVIPQLLGASIHHDGCQETQHPPSGELHEGVQQQDNHLKLPESAQQVEPTWQEPLVVPEASVEIPSPVVSQHANNESSHQSLSLEEFYNQSSTSLISRFVSSKSMSECLSTSGTLSEPVQFSKDPPHRARSCERFCTGLGGIQSFAMTGETGTIRAGDIVGHFLPHWSNLKRLSVFLSSGIRKNVRELLKHKQLSHLIIDTCLRDDFLEDLIHLFSAYYHFLEPQGGNSMELLQISSCNLLCSNTPRPIHPRLCAVQVLDLSWNTFQNETFTLLLEFVKADRALTGLILASCQLQSNKICELLSVLEERDTETDTLSLSDNRVEDDGCEEALTNFVLHTPTLRKLSLSNVSLASTIEKCPKFVSAVSKHPSLESLDVSNNTLEGSHLRLIENILCHSVVIKTVNLAFNQFLGQELIEMSKRVADHPAARHEKLDLLCMSRNLFDLEQHRQIVDRFSVFAHEVKANCVNLNVAQAEHAAQM